MSYSAARALFLALLAASVFLNLVFLSPAGASPVPLEISRSAQLVRQLTVNNTVRERLQTVPEQPRAGDVIEHTISVLNLDKKAHKAVSVIGEVPVGTVYLEGSAICNVDATIRYAAGSDFRDPPLGVAADKYTAVQFIATQIRGGHRFEAKYRVVVK